MFTGLLKSARTKKSLAYALTFQSYQSTLQDDEISGSRTDSAKNSRGSWCQFKVRYKSGRESMLCSPAQTYLIYLQIKIFLKSHRSRGIKCSVTEIFIENRAIR